MPKPILPENAPPEESKTQALVRRLCLKLSQGEIQRRTQIPQSRLSRWAGGEVPDSVDDVFKLQQLEHDLEVAAKPNPIQAE